MSTGDSMTPIAQERVQRVISILEKLEEGQIILVEDVAKLLQRPYNQIWRLPASDFVDDCLLYTLGDLIPRDFVEQELN
jgi:hypothetical protein